MPSPLGLSSPLLSLVLLHSVDAGLPPFPRQDVGPDPGGSAMTWKHFWLSQAGPMLVTGTGVAAEHPTRLGAAPTQDLGQANMSLVLRLSNLSIC